jgi:hypothetical protein
MWNTIIRKPNENTQGTQCLENYLLPSAGERVGGTYSVGYFRKRYSQSLDYLSQEELTSMG